MTSLPNLATGLIALAYLLLLFACGAADAADPRLDAVVPHGGQRGTEVEVNLHGGRIGQEPQEILFDQPGISVLEIKSADGNRATARLAIAPDCPLGPHALCVRTASGLTTMRLFYVGNLPELTEQEPNNDFAAPQAIEVDRTVNGVVNAEDVDYFVVEAKAGERLTAEIEALRLGRTFFDPYVAILNEQRFELASCDDTPLLLQDGFCSVVVPEDGRYIIEVRETAYRGSGAADYRLHVGRFPRPVGAHPAGGKPGEKVVVRWIGDAKGKAEQEITLPAEPSERFELFRQDGSGFSPSGVSVRVQDLQNYLEQEPNNDREQASPMALPGAACGILNEPGDHDYFRFSAKKGQVFHLRVFARQIRSPIDSVMHVFGPDGKVIVGNDDRQGRKPDSYIRFQTPADGEYTVRLMDKLASGGPEYVYRIEASAPIAKCELQLHEERRYFAQPVVVPQGNRAAVMVRATRQDFGGDLSFQVSDLPEGVAVESVNMPANRPLVPMLFSAEHEAKLAGTLANITATRVDGAALESHFTQQHWMIRGRNNIDMWSYMADRPAVAVTQRVPFSIRIVQPQVPLVQSGSLGLRIVAEREGDFNEPISIRLLYNPPGISSSRSIKIAKDQTEAVVPVTANGKAQTGEWPIVAMGVSNVAGRVEVASPFAKLNVAAPYLALKLPSVAGEQGQSVEYKVEVEPKTKFTGTASVELVGLPPGATTAPQEITAGSKEVTFPIALAKDARAGQHKTLVCKVVITENEEPISHTIGTGQLRVDEPLPPEESSTAANSASNSTPSS